MRSVSFQPGLPSASAAARASASTSCGTPASAAVVVDVERPGVGRVEQVVVEPRRKLRELLLDRLEARLLRVGQLGAAQAEIAQFVGDGPRSRGVERRERRRRGERAIAIEQPQILREVGVERRDLRQVGVVGVAQLGRAHDGVEMLDGAPRAIQPVERVGKRLGDRVPGRGSRRPRRPRRPRRARASTSASIAGVTCCGRIASKRGRPEKSSSGLAWAIGSHAEPSGQFPTCAPFSKSGGPATTARQAAATRRTGRASVAVERGEILGRADVRPRAVVMLAGYDVRPAIHRSR